MATRRADRRTVHLHGAENECCCRWAYSLMSSVLQWLWRQEQEGGATGKARIRLYQQTESDRGGACGVQSA